ncbi:FAD/NAD(P)-binding oxidoreductase [Blastococcus brunescens]|uniref:FAD/NAD(P)-binding oxidoreductase n=1 Tax=Blastococcus brunescens TaxID=1564165 RepID=A0ABZ1B216_9ACTN|nr:FAD/NAD(P)-binding oxidoreductase [Blastococcus sp. BMG 8361]WRL64856.1 FAD/NAD(P)-binding oxidoreductase [Blastococcus sp. BMG 8361]
MHRYKPLLNYVGAGEATMADLERPMADVVPDGCTWVRDSVEAVDPATMTVRTRGGRTLSCATLVVCPGLVEDWEATPGLLQAYADGWAASTYVPGSAPQVWPRLSSLRAGSVVFTVPPEPASCAPTALKPLLMACDSWQRSGVLGDLHVRLVLPGATATGLSEADEVLERTFADYGVEVLREARIERVDWDLHALTVASPSGRRVLEDVAFAHAVPHYRAPGWIADAGLAAGGTGVWSTSTRRRCARAGTSPSGRSATRPTPPPARPAERCASRSTSWPGTSTPPRAEGAEALRRLHGHADHREPPEADAQRGRPRRPAEPVGALSRPLHAPPLAVVLRPLRAAADLLAPDPPRQGVIG